jgi:hypothetical protein
MGGMKKPVRIAILAAASVVLVCVIGAAISGHLRNRQRERETEEAIADLKRIDKESEDLGREYARKDLKLFEGRTARNGAEGHPSEMVTALAAISDPSARIKPGSDLERWLRSRFKRSGRFTPDEVRQVAEAEIDSEMPDSARTETSVLVGIMDEGMTDLAEGGEDGLIAVFGQELRRLYPDQFPEAYRILKEEKR